MQTLNVILLSALAVMSLCCKSDPEPQAITYLTIQVVDDVTGGPLGNVNSTILFFNTTTGFSNPVYATTRPDGKINLQFFEEVRLEYMNCELEGYVGKYVANVVYTAGDSNLVEARMSRYDGAIRLDVENTSAATDSLYFTLRSGVVIRESGNENDQFKGDYPIIVQPGEQKTYHIQTVAEDAVSIFWSWDNTESIALIPFRHVVIPPRGDTLVYKVTN